MANTLIENELKTLIDADAWAVLDEGITKNTYVWADSQALALDLSWPYLKTATNIIIVIHPSTRQLLNQTYGSEVYSFQGEMTVWCNNLANLKKALDELKQIADGEQHLLLFFPGINGDPNDGVYYANVIYRWAKHVTHA